MGNLARRMTLAAIAAEAHSLSRKIAATRTVGASGKRAAIESVRRDCEAAMDKIGIQKHEEESKNDSGIQEAQDKNDSCTQEAKVILRSKKLPGKNVS